MGPAIAPFSGLRISFQKPPCQLAFSGLPMRDARVMGANMQIRVMIRFLYLAALASGVVVSAAHAVERVPDDPGALREAALRIDRQVAAFYRSRNLPVPDVTDDATFLRRAYLVAVGRIPTYEEAVDFLGSDAADKRAGLIARLMASPGYASHMANWAFDHLRVTDGRAGSRAGNEPYRQWVRRAMADNMPWDEFTRRLLASSGDGWDPESAAVGYYTRDRGMPLDNLSNTMRVFLGARMECAQCHDDPFGDTKRRDFYQLAAFTHGQQPMGDRAIRSILGEFRRDEERSSHEYRVARMLADQVFGMSIAGGGTGRIPLPSDYQYRDGRPGETVGGRTPFGRTVRLSARRDDDRGREKFADWVIHRSDGRFAGVIANRMWKRVMGRGLYEPVDTYLEPSETHHPEMAALLGELMIGFGYDLRAFQHALLLTRTFQFATNPNPSTVESGDDFHGRKIQRLSAEQIWDSLVTLAAGDPDQLPTREADDTIRLDGRPVLVGKKSMTQLSGEVLAIDGERELRAYLRKLVAEIREDGGSASGASMTMAGARRPGGNALVRASELPSPAPRNHMLYLFGASDREVVDSSSREPNVGQVLTLMNGFVQQRLVNQPDTRIHRSIDGVESATERVRRLFIAVLSRPPTDPEMFLMLDEIKARGPDEGGRNILSALIMSSEFLFLQ